MASDHANTLLCTAYGRTIQNALRKGHAQAGFEYVRFHGILDDDIGVYSGDASGAPVYDWTRFDQVYDSIVSAGMRPIVELSFTPSALASDPTRDGFQRKLWYNGVYPNISPPKDWNRWQDFMAEIVGHLEQRYGADEVRNHWYFEVWNEPSWMYSLGDGGYHELYENTVLGLLRADPAVKVGGPAGSSGESPSLIRNLIDHANARGLKLDFISYHRYGGDSGTAADANASQLFHQQMVNVLAERGFTGELINDEFGAASTPDLLRDSEASASFIAKTISLIGTDPAYSPPSTYAHWTLSDLYEEINTGAPLAYREGNYGLLLKGDPQIPESFDVAKPAFNAFRLLHRMGDTQLSVSGGSTANGVNAVATLAADQHSLQVLVYHHVAGPNADSTLSTLVSLTINHLPFAPSTVRVRHFVVDRTHANSYRVWVGMNKPKVPTREQWVALRDAAERGDGVPPSSEGSPPRGVGCPSRSPVAHHHPTRGLSRMRQLLFLVPLLVGCGGKVDADTAAPASDPEASTNLPADDDVPPPEPSLPTPPSPDAYVDPYADCDATERSDREDGCHLVRTCESGATQYVACTRIEDETWRCSCQDFYGEKVVQLSATDGPCELVGAACPTFEMPRFDGDPECQDSGSSSANSCEFGSRCVRTAPIDEAFTAVEIVSFATVVCSSTGEGTYACGCLGGPGKGVMRIDANRVQLSEVCGLLMPGCTGDGDPRFEAWSCTQRSEELTEEGCRLVQDCAREGMPGDVPVTVNDTALVNCLPSDAGGALCTCATNFFGSATIEVNEDPTDSATCQVGFDRCAASIELVPGGDESCELISMATFPEACTASLRCSRPAIAAGEDVLVYAGHFARCQLDGDVYACRCKGMADGEFFRVETSDSEAACAEAIEQCPDHGSVSYSPGIYQD